MSKSWKSRVYYRNPFFHIGHLNTLAENQRMARNNNGICFAIIDDRQYPDRVTNIQIDLNYLKLDRIIPVSVKEWMPKIMEYVKTLVKQGHIILCRCTHRENNYAYIIEQLNNPTTNYQLRLLSHTDESTIGFSNTEKDGSLALIFDFIIKVLDNLLEITDIVTTSNNSDINDIKDDKISDILPSNIRYHHFNTYNITHFKYSKRGWTADREDNPNLLTIKGMRARHIPVRVLQAFYIHGCQMGTISVNFLNRLLHEYLVQNSTTVNGAVNPIKICISNWPLKTTRYYDRMTMLSDHCYVSHFDCGMGENKVNLGVSVQLVNGPTLTCTETNSDGSVITAKLDEETSINTDSWRQKKLQWISSSWDTEPHHVCFHVHVSFYTGHNSLLKPEVIYGYIDKRVFEDLSCYYYLDKLGYFIYDRELSLINGRTTFMVICTSH
jgi:hypothetical protein